MNKRKLNQLQLETYAKRDDLFKKLGRQLYLNDILMTIQIDDLEMRDTINQIKEVEEQVEVLGRLDEK